MKIICSRGDSKHGSCIRYIPALSEEVQRVGEVGMRERTVWPEETEQGENSRDKVRRSWRGPVHT